MDEERAPYKNPLAGLDLPGVQSLLKERLATLPHGYKLPYMQWYEDDFKSSDGVEEMAPLARLMYRQLLAKAWVSREAPYLPMDKERLIRLADCPDEESWKRHSGSILSMFAKTKDKKKLFHPRQLLDYTAQIVRISANTNNGKKGGRPAKPKKTEDDSETQLKPNQNPTKRQSELESELKPTPKSTPESTDEILDFETDGQGDEMNLKTFKAEMTGVGARAGVKVKGYDNTWDELKIQCIAHGYSTVVNDFEAFLSENSGNEYPKGVLQAYAWVAGGRLVTDSPLQASAKDPEVVSLARELSYLSDGQISFMDKQRTRLAEVLKEFSAAEITATFSAWYADQDTNDPKNVSFLAGKFVQIVDGLAYAARKKKTEKDQYNTAREATAKRMSEEAEAARQAQAKKEAEMDFNPFA